MDFDADYLIVTNVCFLMKPVQASRLGAALVRPCRYRAAAERGTDEGIWH
jgi:hypothetical protein